MQSTLKSYTMRLRHHKATKIAISMPIVEICEAHACKNDGHLHKMRLAQGHSSDQNQIPRSQNSHYQRHSYDLPLQSISSLAAKLPVNKASLKYTQLHFKSALLCTILGIQCQLMPLVQSGIYLFLLTSRLWQPDLHHGPMQELQASALHD